MSHFSCYVPFVCTNRILAEKQGTARPCRLTGQSLLRAERNSNQYNWSTARKKIGPVNRPCDRPIDVISIASLMILATSRLADQRMKTNRAADEPGRCPAGLGSGIVNKFGANPHAVTKL